MNTTTAVMIVLTLALLGLHAGYAGSPAGAVKKLATLNIDFNVGSFCCYAEKGNGAVVRLFLDAGMHPDEKDCHGLTPLHYAAISGSEEVMMLLIAEGADVNSKDHLSGCTPLWYARQADHREAAELLKKYGARE